MKPIKWLITSIVAMAFFTTTAYASSAPRSSDNDAKTVTEKTLFVGPRQVDCQGEAPQKCYLVKESADAEWTYFYDQIAGFTWEAGNQYELRVRVTPIENPPADASSVKYELIKVVSKKAVN